MDKHFTYLLINILTIFFPIILSFDKKVAYHRSWKYLFPGLLITGALFLVWDYLFTQYNVWSFNPDYITGIYFLNLPLEEILFFITVPFACVFIYECLNFYIKEDVLEKLSKPIIYLQMLVSLVMLALFYDRIYTLINSALLLALSIYCIIKDVKLGRFYLAYIVSLIPFYLVNGILTAIPVVMYNDAENSGFRVGTIPFEDHFYSLSLFLMNVLFLEYFRRRSSDR